MPRYASVDIGSNSVRMMAAETNGGETKILAQDRQVTRLGESVFRPGVSVLRRWTSCAQF